MIEQVVRILKGFYKILARAYRDFVRHDAFSLSAATAFYTALSLAPLLIIFFTIMGTMGVESQKDLINQIGQIFGAQAKSAFETIVASAEHKQLTGKISAVVAFCLLLFSSTRIFAQLHKTMNIIWGVHSEASKSFFYWLRENLFSLAMLAMLGVLLVVSLVSNTAIALLFSGEPTIWRLINHIATPLSFSIVFALIFKVLPKVKTSWRESWVAALVTAILFTAGNMAIGKYLGKSSISSIYGAAGSLIFLLIWVYYLALIVFFGAELMQAYSHLYGSRSKARD